MDQEHNFFGQHYLPETSKCSRQKVIDLNLANQPEFQKTDDVSWNLGVEMSTVFIKGLRYLWSDLALPLSNAGPQVIQCNQTT